MILSYLQKSLIGSFPTKIYTVKIVNEYGTHIKNLAIESTNYCSILGYLGEAYPFCKFTILNIESCESCSA